MFGAEAGTAGTTVTSAGSGHRSGHRRGCDWERNCLERLWLWRLLSGDVQLRLRPGPIYDEVDYVAPRRVLYTARRSAARRLCSSGLSAAGRLRPSGLPAADRLNRPVYRQQIVYARPAQRAQHIAGSRSFGVSTAMQDFTRAAASTVARFRTEGSKWRRRLLPPLAPADLLLSRRSGGGMQDPPRGDSHKCLVQVL